MWVKRKGGDGPKEATASKPKGLARSLPLDVLLSHKPWQPAYDALCLDRSFSLKLGIDLNDERFRDFCCSRYDGFLRRSCSRQSL
jgi:hypothetical protein